MERAQMKQRSAPPAAQAKESFRKLEKGVLRVENTISHADIENLNHPIRGAIVQEELLVWRHAPNMWL